MFGMYCIGLVVAPLVALLLKRTLLRGETPVFVMEMPLYKLPSLRTVLRRMCGRRLGLHSPGRHDHPGQHDRRLGPALLPQHQRRRRALRRPDRRGGRERERAAGTLEELEESIAEQKDEMAGIKDSCRHRHLSNLYGLLWPSAEEQAALKARLEELETEIAPTLEKMKPLEEVIEPVQKHINQLNAEWKSSSYLGQLGHAIEPVVRPLGWDWRIGMAALASFPAREVVVGTLGIIYNLGEVDTGEIERGRRRGRDRPGPEPCAAEWDDQPGRKVFTVPDALSLHGLLRPVLPVRLDAGRHQARNQHLALAGLHVRLHDGAGLRRGLDRLSDWSRLG